MAKCSSLIAKVKTEASKAAVVAVNAMGTMNCIFEMLVEALDG
jgi:hypothetical protein